MKSQTKLVLAVSFIMSFSSFPPAAMAVDERSLIEIAVDGRANESARLRAITSLSTTATWTGRAALLELARKANSNAIRVAAVRALRGSDIDLKAIIENANAPNDLKVLAFQMFIANPYGIDILQVENFSKSASAGAAVREAATNFLNQSGDRWAQYYREQRALSVRTALNEQARQTAISARNAEMKAFFNLSQDEQDRSLSDLREQNLDQFFGKVNQALDEGHTVDSYYTVLRAVIHPSIYLDTRTIEVVAKLSRIDAHPLKVDLSETIVNVLNQVKRSNRDSYLFMATELLKRAPSDETFATVARTLKEEDAALAADSRLMGIFMRIQDLGGDYVLPSLETSLKRYLKALRETSTDELLKQVRRAQKGANLKTNDLAINYLSILAQSVKDIPDRRTLAIIKSMRSQVPDDTSFGMRLATMQANLESSVPSRMAAWKQMLGSFFTQPYEGKSAIHSCQDVFRSR